MIRYRQLAGIFLSIGSRGYGGWSSMALLSEVELVDKRRLISRQQLQAAVATGQMLPGATGVSIAANLGHKLRGLPGALVATSCYLLPAICLVLAFAAVYFRLAPSSDLTAQLDGLTAALGGIILANAVQLGKRHSNGWRPWALVALAFVIQLRYHLNPVILLGGFGLAGLIWYLAEDKRS